MTMAENANLVRIFESMGLKAQVGDFILGLEGDISPEEAAKRILEGLESKDE